jgi:DNA-binding transcriptional ArsR family regulator
MAKKKKKNAGPDRKKSRIDPRLVKALGHPLRVEILEVLERGVASPTEVADVLNVALQHVSYHVRMLAEYGCIELVRARPVRGAQEHFYKPLPKASIGHPNWQSVPRALVGDLVFSVLQEFVRKVVLALRAGTIGSYEETPLGSMTIMVDDIGRDEARGIVHDAQARLSEIDTASRQRSSGGDSLKPYVTGWALFPAAPPPKGRGDL